MTELRLGGDAAPMRLLLVAMVLLVGGVWAWEMLTVARPAAHPLWLARQELLTLSGTLAIALMSLAMYLASRPLWLEGLLGGMDRVYRTHKWAAILATGFALAHWLVEMGDDILKSLVGRAGRVPEEKFSGFLEVLRELAEDAGEWAIYGLLFMVALSLWRRFPYRPWRFLHQAMPVIYLALALHAALLAPRAYWQQPVGALLAVLLLAGSYGAVRSLFGTIGHARQVSGKILTVEASAADVLTVVCQLDQPWRGHRPGQFAFLRFEQNEAAHPFTIASADHGDRLLRFHIKALGDYTRSLAGRLQPGQPVTLEGPYGRFDLARCQPQRRQVWIAGGVGVTPFLAWLEALQSEPARALAADLHYCSRDAGRDPFVARLEDLCAGLPGVRLQVHDASVGERLAAAALGDLRAAEIWFCGPQGLAEALRSDLRAMGVRPRFHQEAFALR
ncbi:MAG TPA: ferric reductase-like transmembrane domain-containing protein [Rhodocyclaceae bacterium]|nr:ferric reductase-like transmembrane domain-containing protein [Rhodocyclaceae bacterium]